MNDKHKHNEERRLHIAEKQDNDRHNGGATHPQSEVSTREEARVTEETRATEEKATLLLVGRNDKEDFQSRWHTIQMGFVDEPHGAVENADALVAEVIDYLSKALAAERDTVNQDWMHEDNLSTEELRLALRDYRTLFNHLISI